MLDWKVISITLKQPLDLSNWFGRSLETQYGISKLDILGASAFSRVPADQSQFFGTILDRPPGWCVFGHPDPAYTLFPISLTWCGCPDPFPASLSLIVSDGIRQDGETWFALPFCAMGDSGPNIRSGPVNSKIAECNPVPFMEIVHHVGGR